MATIYRALLLLVGIVLTARLCACKAHGGVGVGDGFSVELIHRDSVKSPYHDPALSAHDRVLAAIRRSTARAEALAHGIVSQVVSKPFESLMVVNVGTPPTRMLAIVDTGSDLVWFKCKPHAATAPPGVVFDPFSSSTFERVPCYYDACHALTVSQCDGSYNCYYDQSYLDGSNTNGFLSTETFTFDSIPGGCARCRDYPEVRVPKIHFGCSASSNGTLILADGIVGLGPQNYSLVSQLGTRTTLGRRFSYCTVPFYSNVSSALNFGARAAVTEPGAVTAVMLPASSGSPYYTLVLQSVKIGGSTFQHSSNVLIDSGTALTILDKGLIDQMVKDISWQISLPTVQSPDKLMQLCYAVSGSLRTYIFRNRVPDVTMYFGEAAVTLKVDNLFVEVQKGFTCLAMTPVTEQMPYSILGSIAQQNMHVGYDLDKRTITFAPADCASSYTRTLSEAHDI
uniref:Uncharacterized protein n=1 Tax=Avena sativa TaxID=4498 RepID=A0ACD5VCV4_AVESA